MKPRHLALTFVALLSAAACAGDSTPDSDESFVSVAKEGGQVELFRSAKDKQFYFRLKAANGEKILASEGYVVRAGAERGIYSVLHSGLQVGAFKLHPASTNPEGAASGEWYFNLHAPNGEIVGSSEVYSSKQAAKKGRSTVMAYVAGKPRIDDWANQCGANLFQGADDQLYFHLRGLNGRVLLSSEGYPDEHVAKKGIQSVLTNSSLAERF